MHLQVYVLSLVHVHSHVSLSLSLSLSLIQHMCHPVLALCHHLYQSNKRTVEAFFPQTTMENHT